MPYLDEKPAYRSGTLYGSIGGAIAAAALTIHGIKTGNTQEIGEGIIGLFGFFTTWRLRKAQGVAISGAIE